MSFTLKSFVLPRFFVLRLKVVVASNAAQRNKVERATEFQLFFCRSLECCQDGNVPMMRLTTPYFKTKTPMGVQMGATMFDTRSLWVKTKKVNCIGQKIGMLLFELLIS